MARITRRKFLPFLYKVVTRLCGVVHASGELELETARVAQQNPDTEIHRHCATGLHHLSHLVENVRDDHREDGLINPSYLCQRFMVHAADCGTAGVALPEWSDRSQLIVLQELW